MTDQGPIGLRLRQAGRALHLPGMKPIDQDMLLEVHNQGKLDEVLTALGAPRSASKRGAKPWVGFARRVYHIAICCLDAADGLRSDVGVDSSDLSGGSGFVKALCDAVLRELETVEKHDETAVTVGEDGRIVAGLATVRFVIDAYLSRCKWLQSKDDPSTTSHQLQDADLKQGKKILGSLVLMASRLTLILSKLYEEEDSQEDIAAGQNRPSDTTGPASDGTDATAPAPAPAAPVAFVHQGMAAAIYHQAFPKGHTVVPNDLPGVQNIISAVVAGIRRQTDVLDTHAANIGPTNHKHPATVFDELMSLATAGAVRDAYANGGVVRASALDVAAPFETAAVALYAWGRNQMPGRVVQLMRHDADRGPRHEVLIREEPDLYVWVEGMGGGGGHGAMEPLPAGAEEEGVKSLVNEIKRLQGLVKSLEDKIHEEA